MASHTNTNTQTPKLFPTKFHHHSLELKHYHKPYTCDGCKETGFGHRYRCEICNYDLHELCMSPQLSPTSHEFFPKATFEFLETPTEGCCEFHKPQCDACRKPINGFVYHCKRRDLDLHPCCRNLKRKYRIGSGKEEMEFELCKKVKSKCLWCNKRSINEGDHCNGWSYISKCKNFHVHVACVTEMITVQWTTLKWDSVNETGSSTDQSLALQNVNLKEIQARAKGNGKHGNKYWRTIKLFLRTIVGIVLGDPTIVFVNLFLELLG